MTEVSCASAAPRVSLFPTPSPAFLQQCGKRIVKSTIDAAHFFATGSSMVAIAILLM